MRTTRNLKNLGDIANLHDLRSIPRMRRSAKPALPTTAVMSLYMSRNERDRLVKERMLLAKRKVQVDRRLIEIEQDMDALLEEARKKAMEIRGEPGTPVEVKVEKRSGRGRAKMVVAY